VLGILWLFLVYREIEAGPEPDGNGHGEDTVLAEAN
jgi:hypothetical protein